MSAIRDGQLVVAVGAATAVPLVDTVKARGCRDLVQEAELVFRRHEPEFELREVPIDIGVVDRRRIMVAGQDKLGGYEAFVDHSSIRGVPGDDECMRTASSASCFLA